MRFQMWTHRRLVDICSESPKQAMIMKIFADSGKIRHRRNAKSGQMIGIPDTMSKRANQ
jgi:hypothetical protein